MMTLTEGIRTYLLSVPEIATLVNRQIYGSRRPQGPRPLPEVLITRITTQRGYTFCGQMDLINCDMQLDCYASGLAQAEALAKILKQELRLGGMFGDVPVNAVFLSNESEIVDSDPGTVRMIQTYTFWYQED